MSLLTVVVHFRRAPSFVYFGVTRITSDGWMLRLLRPTGPPICLVVGTVAELALEEQR